MSAAGWISLLALISTLIALTITACAGWPGWRASIRDREMARQMDAARQVTEALHREIERQTAQVELVERDILGRRRHRPLDADQHEPVNPDDLR